MAFLSRSGTESYFFTALYAGSNARNKTWVYITPDSFATVTVANYFTLDIPTAVASGDFIDVIQASNRNDLSTGSVGYRLMVTTVVAGVSGTTSFAVEVFNEKGESWLVSVTDPQFGATGDGVTDDGPAINLAAAWVRSETLAGRTGELFFPNGVYLTTIPLNFTDIRTVEGRNFITGLGAIVYGKCTGKDIFDFKRSNRFTIRGISVKGDATLKPRNGFYIGRGKYQGANTSGAGESADAFMFLNCSSAGYFQWAGLYNFASERFLDIGGVWRNDSTGTIAVDGTLVAASETIGVPYAVILDSGNQWNASSDYYTAANPITVNHEVSHLNQQFIGTSFIRAYGGQCLWMTTGVGRFNMQGTYFACKDGDAIVLYVPRYQVTIAHPSPNFRRLPTAWNVRTHMEADSDDETLTFRNGVRIVPCDTNGGSAITINFKDFEWYENNFHGDNALFLMSSIFPAGSSVNFRSAEIKITAFRGNIADEDGDGGAPTKGVFAPSTGSTMRVGGNVFLPSASGVGQFPTAGVTVNGLLDSYGSATSALTNYPLGSYVNQSSQDIRYHKGNHSFWGDKDTTYTGTDFNPPSPRLTINAGRAILWGNAQSHNLDAVTVTTRTLVKGADTTLGTVYLNSGKRSGWFRWDSTVPIATHQADTQEGIYLPPSAGAIGAWTRVYSGPVYAGWFGATIDGVTDDFAALQGAIDLLKYIGGGELDCGDGVFATSDVLLVSGNNIYLKGRGAGYYQAVPSAVNIRASAATRIVRLTAGTTGPVLKFSSPSGGQRKLGGGVSGIMLDGNGRATSCLHIESRAHGRYENVALVYATESNLLMNTLTSAVLSAVPYDTQENTFINVFCINLNFTACDSAYAFRTDSYESTAEPSASMGSPNVSFNTFINCTFRSNIQHAIWLVGATDNTFIACRVSIESDPAFATYYGWVLCSSSQDVNLGWSSAKRNSFLKCSGVVWARAGQTGGLSSYANSFYGHHSSTYLQFKMPFVIEAPAGGSLAPVLWMANEYGYLDHVDLYAEYTNVGKTYKRGGIRTATVAVTTNAVTNTATGLIPAGAIVFGVATRVTTAIVGATSYSVGDGVDIDRWGAGIPWNNNSLSDNSDWTVASIGVFPNGNDVVITAAGGTPTSGVVNISVFYLTAEAAYSA